MVSVDDDPIPFVRSILVCIFVTPKYLLHEKKRKNTQKSSKVQRKSPTNKISTTLTALFILQNENTQWKSGCSKGDFECCSSKSWLLEKNGVSQKTKNFQHERGEGKCKFFD